MSQLTDPFNVNYFARGVEPNVNGQWTKALTINSTSNSYPLKQNWSSVATSSDGKYVLACVYGGKIYSSSNYGYNLLPETSSILPSSASWSCIKISTDGTLAVACINGGGIFIGNLSANIWNWVDSGAPDDINYKWSSVSISDDNNSIIACLNEKDVLPFGAYIGTYSANNWSWTQPTGWDKSALFTSITFSGDNLSIAACFNSMSTNGPYISMFNTNSSEWGPLLISGQFPYNYQWSSITKFGSSKNFIGCIKLGGIFKAIYNDDPNNPAWSWTQSSAPTANWSCIASNTTGQYIIACINGGGLYSSIDYGNSWQEQTNGLTNPLAWTYVDIASNSAGSFLVGCVQNDYIYISPYFQGYQWNSSLGNNERWLSLASDYSGQNLIAGSLGTLSIGGYIYISNDYGITWNPVFNITSGTGPVQFWQNVASNNNGLILGIILEPANNYDYDGIVFISLDNGSSWISQQIETYPLASLSRVISFNGDGTKAVVCSGATINQQTAEFTSGEIYYNNDTTDPTNWQKITPTLITPTAPNILTWPAIKFSGNGEYIYACCIQTDGGEDPVTGPYGIYKGIYDSSSNTWLWSLYPINTIYNFNSISCSNDGQFVSATNSYYSNSSTIWVSNNYGDSFFNPSDLPVVSNNNYGFQSITMSSNGQKIAAAFFNSDANTGSIYLSLDYGVTWVTQNQGLPTSNNAWISIASNQNMTKLLIGPYFGSNAPAYVSSNGIFTAFLSESCWTPQLNAVPTRNAFTKLTSSYNGQYLAVIAENQTNVGSPNNDYGGIWISWDNGSTWIKSDASNLCWNAISSDNTGQYLVAGVYGGQIYTSSNYGLNWISQTSTSGLPTSANWCALSFSNNSDSLSTSQYVYAAVASGQQQESPYTYDGGYIYFSTNRGLTWTSINLFNNWGNGIASSSDGEFMYVGASQIYGTYEFGLSTQDVFPNSFEANWNYIATDSTGKYIVAVNSNITSSYSDTNTGIWLGISDLQSTPSFTWNQIASKALDWKSISLVNMVDYLLITAVCTNGLVYTCNYLISNPNTNTFYETTGGIWFENIIDFTYTITCTQGDTNTNIKFNDSILVNVTVVGAGGAGSGKITYLNNDGLGGGGGGGGIAVNSFYTVPQTQYTTIVGTKGLGVHADNGNNGNFSLFTDGNLLNIKGFGGGGGVGSLGGASGTGLGGTNNYLGGNGGNSGMPGNNSELSPYSGSGAGGSDINGSLKGGYAGNAGIGGALQYTNDEGQNAATYGSGGGGVGNFNLTGGNGSPGVIIITFTIPNYSWTLQGNLPASQWSDIKSSILPSGDVQLVMCSTNGGIWKSSDSGSTWSQSVMADNTYQTGITSSSIGQNLVAIVNNGFLYSSTNFGSSWNTLPNSLPLYTYMNWNSIASSITGQIIVASTIIGEIYKSENYGQTWNKSVLTYAYPILSMSSSGQYIAAASNGGSIYLSSDYGSIWTQLTSINGLPSIPEAWSAISISESGQYIAASIYGGNTYISSNFGSTWFSINLSKNWTSTAISDSGQNIVATISSGSIYGSSNFGTTWTEINSSAQLWSSISISGTGQYINASTNDGSIYGSSNFGLTWAQINTTTTTEFNSITSSKTAQYLATIGINSGTPNETDIYIYSNYMDIGNIYGSLINQLQIQMQYQNPIPTGSINAFLGTTDPHGWVIMDGQPRTNEGKYNKLLLMGIGTGTNNNTLYTPPDYKGAFLRGTGGTAPYIGPNINNSQTDNAYISSNQSISVSVPIKYNVSGFYYAYGPDFTSFNSLYVPDSNTGSISTTPSAIGGSGSLPTLTQNSGITETRPYNFGVNWILKL